jgi:hypothetical protein
MARNSNILSTNLSRISTVNSYYNRRYKEYMDAPNIRGTTKSRWRGCQHNRYFSNAVMRVVVSNIVVSKASEQLVLLHFKLRTGTPYINLRKGVPLICRPTSPSTISASQPIIIMGFVRSITYREIYWVVGED